MIEHSSTPDRSTYSIYQYLLWFGMLLLFCGLSFSGLFAYISTQHEVNELFDAMLIENTRAIKGLVNHKDTDWFAFQRSLNEPVNRSAAASSRLSEGFAYQDKLAIQIWGNSGDLIVASPSAPNVAMATFKTGFTQHSANNHTWYVNTVWIPENSSWLMVAQRSDIRAELSDNIAASMLLGAILCLVIVFWLFRRILRQGLYPLTLLSNNIASRTQHYLEPIQINHPPQELVPVVNELNSLFKKLQQAAAREQRFIADAAHELRTPLTVIKLQVQQALNVGTNDKQVYLRKLLGSVDRHQQVIEQLLLMARLESDQHVTRSVVFLDELARETISLIIPLAMQQQVDIVLHADDRLRIFGEASLCIAMLRNLIDNAVKHSPSNSTITVYVKRENSKIQLLVEDQGSGINETLLQQMTTRFWQENPARGHADRGSGLGLAIAAHIAQLHGTRLSLKNIPCGGLSAGVLFDELNRD